MVSVQRLGARVPRWLRPRNWQLLIGLAAVIVLLPVMFDSQYVLTIMEIAGIWVILAVGLSVLVGGSGELSLAMGAFYGVGAYAFALLVLRSHLHFVLAMGGAMLVCGAIALVVGLPLLRTRGLAFAIVTLGFAIIASDIFDSWRAVTNGVLGITDIPVPSLKWLPALGSEDYPDSIRTYYLIWGCAIAVLAVVLRMMGTEYGLVLRGIGGDERLVESLGFRPGHFRLSAFVITALAAGLAGPLYGMFIGFIAPGSFTFWVAFAAVIMAVIGGRERPWGAMVAAVVLTALPEFLRVAAGYRLIIYAVVLYVVLLIQHRGLALWRR